MQIVLMAMLLNPFKSDGQNAIAKTDIAVISIGEQFKLTIEFSAKKETSVIWPALPDTFSTLEVISKQSPDTIYDDSGNIVIRQQYIITGFDSGYHVIPPLSFIETVTKEIVSETRPLLITVNTVQIEPEKDIRDIKDIQHLPITFDEILPYILIILALIFAVYLFYRYFKNRKSM
jgi:hypothetical protein